MKSIIVTAIVVASISLISCDKNGVDPISEDFGNVDLASTENPDGSRTDNGQRPELTEVAIADLPTSITDYISSNYPGANIEKAGTAPEGNFAVKIVLDEGKKGLLFDAAGNFVKELARGKKGQRPPLEEVSPDDLPSAITDYLIINYPEASIEKAGTDPEGNYVVVFNQADQKQAILFDSSGNFIKELQGNKEGKKRNRPPLTTVEIADLSAAIIDYIASNYPDMNIEKAGTNMKGDFIVLLSDDENSLALLFDADGVFQKELPPPHQGGGTPQE